MIPTENINPGIDFNREVMRRVNLVFYAKKLFNPIVLESVALVGILGSIAFFVSIKSVLNNYSSVRGFVESGSFWFNAVYYTESHVQCVLGVALILGGVLGYQTLKKTLKNPYFSRGLGIFSRLAGR